MQTIYMENESYLKIKGVKKIETCTNNSAAIDLTEKRLILEGNDIEIKKLDLENEEITLVGNFSQIKFKIEKEKLPLLKKIFK